LRYRARLIGACGIAACIEAIGEQTPAIGGSGIQLHGAAQRRFGLPPATEFQTGDAELEVRGRRIRELRSERFQHLKRCLQPSCAPVRGAQDEARHRILGLDEEDLACLLGREVRIFLEQAPRMRNRELHRPKALRGHVQSCTRYIPNLVIAL
jgi:hypothetical protein